MEQEKAVVNSDLEPEINMLAIIDVFDDNVEDENKTQETKDSSES